MPRAEAFPASHANMSSDELTVPTQQRVRPHREARPRRPRQRTAQRRQQRTISTRQPRPSRLTPQNSQLVAQHKDLQFLRATRRPNKNTSANRLRTARYSNDQSKQPSLHDREGRTYRSRGPGRGRVCEPYARIADFVNVWIPGPNVRRAVAGKPAPPVPPVVT
jgi:hypothetical protein